MRFTVDFNSTNMEWEVRDNFCCDQIIGKHLNPWRAQEQRKHEESLWKRFSDGGHEDIG